MKKSYKDIVKLEVLSIEEIIQKKIKLIIPSYQRGYRWTKKNVTQLLKDILQAYNKKEEYYYIGPIYLINVNSHEDTFTIVDGQQRLTTFVLIIDFIKRNFKEYDISPILLSHARIEERQALSNKLLKKQANLSAYLDQASTSIIEFFNKNIDDIDDSNLFFDYLIKKVCMVKINVRDEKVSNNLFESLNYKGKKLKAIDLIRNYFFMNIPEEKKDECSIIWEDLESVLTELSNFDDNRSFDNIAKDLFAIYLICDEGKYVSDINLYDSIKNKFNSLSKVEIFRKFQEITVSDNKKFLRAYVSSFRSSFLFWNQFSEISQSKLKSLTDKSILRSTLCSLAYAYENKKINNTFMVNIIDDLYSLFNRTTTIGNIPVTKFSEIFANYSNHIWKLKSLEHFDELSKELFYKLLNKSKIFPNELFEENLKITNFVDEIKVKKLLIDIEQFIDSDNKLNMNNCFIHKIFEKNYKDQWINLDLEAISNYENRIGNYFILSKKLYESYNFLKVKNLVNKSNFFYNRQLLSKDEWNYLDIIERSKLISSNTSKAWKFNYIN